MNVEPKFVNRRSPEFRDHGDENMKFEDHLARNIFEMMRGRVLGQYANGKQKSGKKNT